MRHGLKFPNSKITKLQRSQRGYMLLSLLLALALMTIALAVALPKIRQQIMRDREEEMIHRGTAYMRAIQHFYKKFQRYPNKVEELENTNNLRFLRKRYTDPMNRDPETGKERDFKFLHQQDISLNNGPVLGAQPGQPGQGGFGVQGGTATAPGGFGATPGGLNGPNGPGSPNSPNGNSADASSSNSTDAQGNSTSTGSSSSSSSSSNGSISSSNLAGQTFGGGPILGVASTSKAKSIRVFYKKDKYSDWLFIYLPQADQGFLLKGPVNPGMQTGSMGGVLPPSLTGGTTGQGGIGQSGFGQSGFGQSGFGQSGFGQGQGQGFGGQSQSQPQTPPTQPPQQ